MESLASAWRAAPGQSAAALAGAMALLVIASALVLQHGFGYAPCPLCLEQRWPYYIGVPVAALVALPVWPRRLRAAGLAALGAPLRLGASGSASTRRGAEWGFWLGPADCSAGNVGRRPADVGGLLDAIQIRPSSPAPIRSLRILGLSLAGWNAVVMAALAASSSPAPVGRYELPLADPGLRAQITLSSKTGLPGAGFAHSRTR